MATERGKIGRLPNALRDRINGLIRDNAPHADILALLEAEGVEGITPQNISTWKRWGYDKWIQRMQKIDEMKARLEYARQLSEECGGQDGLTLAGDAAAKIALDTITAALESFDPALLMPMMVEKPEKFMHLVDSLASMRAVELKFAEYRRKVKAAVDQAVAVAEEKGSATAEDIKSIFQTAYGV